MKKLHLVAEKSNFKPALKYIQIKGGYVYATNGIIFVKYPLEEVFGENPPFTNKDEVYIFADDWKRQNLFKGEYFSRTTLAVGFDYLHATTKLDSLIGRVKLYNHKQFFNLNGKFPDIDSVIPNSPLVPIIMITFNPLHLKNLIDCLACHEFSYALEFRGEDKITMVDCADSEVVAGIMPIKRCW